MFRMPLIDIEIRFVRNAFNKHYEMRTFPHYKMSDFDVKKVRILAVELSTKKLGIFDALEVRRQLAF